MPSLNNPHHAAPQVPARDPLTDSGVQRAIGTIVRLHLTELRYVDVGLLDIRGANTWRDLVGMVARHAPLEVLAPVRYAFASGMVVYAEVISDWPDA